MGFGFYALEQTFNKLGRLTWDETQLTRRGKNILGSKMAGLITRVLKVDVMGEKNVLLNDR